MSKAESNIERIRKRRRMSQTKLAASAGISQASISRIEKGEQEPTFQVLAKIARALNVELDEVLDEDRRQRLLSSNKLDNFYAFCPNPFCKLNRYGTRNDGTAYVHWKSGEHHDMSVWDDINFCSKCRTDLVKDCQSCHKVLTKNSTYCVKCGAKISSRPTSAEWTQIEKLVKERDPDDIPF